MNPYSKVLLIQPQELIDIRYDQIRFAYNLGFAFISAALKEIGCAVHFIDAAAEGIFTCMQLDKHIHMYGLPMTELISRISEISPNIVGISCIKTTQYPVVEAICKMVKEIDDRIIVILGGAHPSGCYKSILCTNRYVDYIIVGEGEQTFVELIDFLRHQVDPEKPRCTAFRQNGSIFFRPRAKKTHLDQLPDPDYSIFAHNNYRNSHFHSGIIRGAAPVDYIYSRGCDSLCDYCCEGLMWGGTHRGFSFERIQKQICNLREMGFDEMFFMDNNVLLNAKKAIKIFDYVNKLGFFWTICGGLDRRFLDDDIVDKLIATKCSRAYIAFESPHIKILQAYHKYVGLNDEQLKRTHILVERLTKGGVETIGGFMIGFPGETLHDIQNTISYAKMLREEYGLGLALFFAATPYPGTKFFKLCKQKGYLVNENDYSGFSYEKGNITTPEFTADQITDIRVRAMQEVNGDYLFGYQISKLKKRPNLLEFYTCNPMYKWSKYFVNKKVRIFQKR